MAAIVFCPMEMERKAVARAVRAAGLTDVRVVQTGIGKDAVLRALDGAAGNAPRGSLMILAGACGGLAPCADVPAIARIIDEHGGCWTPRMADAAGVTLIAVDRIVATPGEKRTLAERSGASIVDMETHAFAAACEQRGLAWTVVRGVSDTPDETLPAEVLGWVRPDGGTRAGRAALDLLRMPRLVPHIIGVVRRANRVLPRVGERVCEIAREWGAAQTSAQGESQASASSSSAPPPLPLPVAAGAALVILVGGTFDPPHRGHVELPQRVREEVEAEQGCRGGAWLVYVPAARSPHKAQGPAASGRDRLDMLAIALRGVERAAVWEDELARSGAGSGPSYTIDTVLRARARLDSSGGTATALRLLIGADQAAEFHRWREPRRIIEVAEPLVMARGEAGAAADSIVEGMRRAGFWTEAELAAWLRRIVPVGRIDASATEIRLGLASGNAAAWEMLPAGVPDLIRKRGLYGLRTGA